MATGADFRISLNGWAKQTEQNLTALARQTCQQIAENVVKDTPVDTGHLRASWQPSLNKGGTKAAPPGMNTNGYDASTISGTVSKLKLGDIFFLLNGTAYARRVEYGFVGEDKLGRYYNQRGRFFVTRNVKRARTVAKALAKVLFK